MSSSPSDACAGPWTSRASNIAPAQVPKNAPPFAAKSFERVEEAFLGHHLQLRAALAARKNYAVNIREVFGTPDVRMRDAQAVERRGVSLVVTLNGEYPDVHASKSRCSHG